jgi:hypothetical protein
MSNVLTLDAAPLPTPGLPAISRIIDLDSYPIHLPDHPATQALISRCRAELDDVGCAVIPNFMRAESLARMQAEVERLMPQTFWSQDDHNPYMTSDDPTLAQDHPRRFFQKRSSGFINSDILEENSDLRTLYDWQGMTDFVSACVDVTPLHCWADPLGRNPYSIMNEGGYFPWHFDGNEFTVSILVQEADKGGVFEYCPDIRTPEDENFQQVKAVLNGSREGVHELPLKPGDLQLFKGRFSMHRVTEIVGSKQRIIALPTYVTNPESVNRPERSRQFYGRALPVHFEREGIRPDTLTD